MLNVMVLQAVMSLPRAPCQPQGHQPLPQQGRSPYPHSAALPGHGLPKPSLTAGPCPKGHVPASASICPHGGAWCPVPLVALLLAGVAMGPGSGAMSGQVSRRALNSPSILTPGNHQPWRTQMQVMDLSMQGSSKVCTLVYSSITASIIKK